MEREIKSNAIGTAIEPLKLCDYIVSAGYSTVVVNALAHIIWFFIEKGILANPSNSYFWEFILFPSIGLLSLNIIVDRLVHSTKVPIVLKEYLSLSLFLGFSLYLSMTHRMANVILSSFVLPIFASSIFSNIKITRWSLMMGMLSIILISVKLHYEGLLDVYMAMELFVSIPILICAYFLAKTLIRFGNDNAKALKSSYRQQQNMYERLKLDPFTELYNKKTFDYHLTYLTKEYNVSKNSICLAIVDIDHFKRLNDDFGHDIGDKVLLHLVGIFGLHSNSKIKIYRIGGEEFAIIFRDMDLREAYRICDNMRKSMANASLSYLNKRKVTFSCGLAIMSSDFKIPVKFLKAADSALYQAKSLGRNQVVVYSKSMNIDK